MVLVVSTRLWADLKSVVITAKQYNARTKFNINFYKLSSLDHIIIGVSID